MLKFVALPPRARFTEVRAEVCEPLIMVEPPVGGQRVPVEKIRRGGWDETGGVFGGLDPCWEGEGGNGMRTVRHVRCFVYVGARVDPLARWFLERAAAPCGCEETEVGVCARGEGGDCEEGGGQHGRRNS